MFCGILCAIFRMIPIDLLILDAIVEMWVSHVRVSSTVTPRNLTCVVLSMRVSFIFISRGKLRTLLCSVKRMYFVLSVLRLSLLVSNYLDICESSVFVSAARSSMLR